MKLFYLITLLIFSHSALSQTYLKGVKDKQALLKLIEKYPELQNYNKELEKDFTETHATRKKVHTRSVDVLQHTQKLEWQVSEEELDDFSTYSSGKMSKLLDIFNSKYQMIEAFYNNSGVKSDTTMSMANNQIKKALREVEKDIEDRQALYAFKLNQEFRKRIEPKSIKKIEVDTNRYIPPTLHKKDSIDTRKVNSQEK
jgi:hypothetical protein